MRIAWLEENWEAPNRTDYYLMQIAQEVRRSVSKSPNKIQMDQFKVKFVPKEHKMTKQEKKSSIASSKSRWFKALGVQK